MEHRDGFSSEALVLISCSLNVIMAMITQMTPGLWGICGSYILMHTLHRRCDSRRDHQTEPVLVALACSYVPTELGRDEWMAN